MAWTSRPQASSCAPRGLLESLGLGSVVMSPALSDTGRIPTRVPEVSVIAVVSFAPLDCCSCVVPLLVKLFQSPVPLKSHDWSTLLFRVADFNPSRALYL